MCAAFEAAEDDGLTGQLVDTDHPRTLDGDTAEPMTEITGRRILALVEVMKNISPPAGTNRPAVLWKLFGDGTLHLVAESIHDW